MTIAEIFVLGFALAMDAVAVSVAQGMRMRHPRWRDALLLAGAFGVFQAAMPLGGWVLSFWFAGVVSAVAPWIAFALLAVLGGMMLREAFSDDEDGEAAGGADAAVTGGTPGTRVATYAPVTLAVVLPLAVATSIDAAAVGVTFGVLSLGVGEVLVAVAIIGVVTAALSLVAVFVGARVGERLGQWAEVVGGVILVLIGLRILLAHLGVLG
ncbi:putative Mn2+ efflux pump MntP [Nocardioides zeae]|uniref:Mn2+ efflux pump MntP n=1 Tax=Nocardioides zeae TaxID=1457234 RepID=A0ACC6IMY8_9ACTN|nr:manganese efflux pump MntP family protein [Nocardioides zeae]MDR6173350.1 putative Mn2+ efflux pump MntP [Nocardioides zeae]MDR6211990.1 putative Mn2+ efflux pump MntP [Nocardioides zeae]